MREDIIVYVSLEQMMPKLINGLVQDSSNTSVLVMESARLELLQSCTKSSIDICVCVCVCVHNQIAIRVQPISFHLGF